jgi:hypothetical protein
MKILHLIAALSLVIAVAWSTGSSADSASHHEAAEKLLELIDMRGKIDASVETVVNLQLQQQPALREHVELLRTFLDKYIGWTGMREELATMYQQAFTEEELNAMNSFYSSPAGQKLIQRLPALIQQRDRIAMQRLQQHIGELQQEIAERPAQ